MTINIDGTAIGRDEPPYVIAEVGINARTDLQLAERFVATAAECGADAVKFQTHIADAEMVEDEMRRVDAGDVYDTVVDCEWSLEDHRQLQSFARDHEITFLSTPFSVMGVDRLEAVGVPAFKVGSGEMANYHLLDRISETGKPVLVSTGMHTRAEMRDTVSFLNDRIDEYALFYCVSEYPTEPSGFEFKTIEALHELADVPVGFSDHSRGVEAAKAAIGYGANVIEKHFTLDRRLPGPDQAVSIEPEELADLCAFADLFHETGKVRDEVTREEGEIKTWAQHSLVTETSVEQGEKFDRDNLTTKRPGTGIPARLYFDVLGSSAATSLPSETMLTEDDVEGEMDPET